LVPSVRCSRGVSRRVMVFAVCRTAFQASARFKSRSEVSSDSTLGTSWVRPRPFDVRCFQPRPSGFRAAPSCRWVSRHRRSSLQVLRLLEAVHSSTAPEWPDPGAPLMQSRPLQRSTETGARITRRVPTAGTVRPQGFSPSRRFASPATMAGLFHPACVPGVESGPRIARRDLSIQAGQTRPGFLSKAFSPITTSTCWRALLPGTSSGAPAKGHYGDFASGEGNKAAQRVLRSLDREGHGVSRGSEPRAPAFMRFLADRPHSRARHVYSTLGLPLHVPERRRRHPADSESFAQLPETCAPGLASLRHCRRP
jgi:hypothetical protein